MSEELKKEARDTVSHKYAMLESDWGIEQKREYRTLEKYIDKATLAERVRLEKFMWNVDEAIRFVKMGSGKKMAGSFAILERIIKEHKDEAIATAIEKDA